MNSYTGRIIIRGEDHKQAGFFAHFQTAGHSGFVNDTEIRFIDKTIRRIPLTLLDMRIFG